MTENEMNIHAVLMKARELRCYATQAADLKAARRRELDEAIDRVREEHERYYATDYADIRKAEEEFAKADADLRNLICEAFRATGEKQIAPGLSVRVNKSLRYDPDSALDWAKTHQLALALDKKAFEKIAGVQPLPFVETVETASAVIACGIVCRSHRRTSDRNHPRACGDAQRDA